MLTLSAQFFGFITFWLTYWGLGYFYQPPDSEQEREQEQQRNKEKETSISHDPNPTAEQVYPILKRNMWVSALYGVFVANLVPTILDSQWSQWPYSFILTYPSSFLLSEIYFYLVHNYIFHNPAFYKYHKLHHTATDPRAYTGVYCSIPEMCFLNMNGAILGPVLFGMPTTDLCFWLIIVGWNVLRSHDTGGRENSLLNKHYKHHTNPNTNFSFLFMDYLFKTSK